jgi:hypothetical protein
VRSDGKQPQSTTTVAILFLKASSKQSDTLSNAINNCVQLISVLLLFVAARLLVAS